MPDVFISYKHRLRSRVDEIATALKALGLDVWYDEGLTSGDDYAGAISEQLRAARCVVVAWSPDVFPPADKHGWVRGEAQKGRDRDVLVAIMLEPTDLDPPWNTVQYENLADWTPDTDDRTNWRRTLRAIGSLVGRPGLAEFDRAQAAGTATALTDWAREFSEDPLVPAVWQKIEELEIAATRERLRAERERKKPDVAPPPLKVEIPQPKAQPKSEPVIEQAPPAPPQSKIEPQPAPSPSALPSFPWLPLVLGTLVNIIGAVVGSVMMVQIGLSATGTLIIFGGPVAGTLIQLVALRYVGLVKTIGAAIIAFVASAVGFALALLFMFIGLEPLNYNYSDPGWVQILVGLVFGGVPLLGALIGVNIVARRGASTDALFKIVLVAATTGLIIGFASMLDGFSILRSDPGFVSLAALWHIGYAIGVVWVLAPVQARSASSM